ncbi:MAG: class I SAM-dependent methyltransferase [Bdellovibrionaceae bacterium]|nr:class I SAM-dependent methyltransferase [Pseudobdellovibrionaceae bacterium]
MEYRKARNLCIRLAQTVSAKIGCVQAAHPQARYALEQVELLREMKVDDCGIEATGVIVEITAALAEVLPKFIVGDIDEAGAFASLREVVGPFWWARLMQEPPMQDYAKSCFEFTRMLPHISGDVLEIGAGVGNYSQLISKIPKKYYRTDIQRSFLTGQYSKNEFVYDFDAKSDLRNLDMVVSVNGLHCSRDKTKALRNMFEVLKPGGVIVLAEGEPIVSLSGEPWALGIIFSIVSGWWAVGGFETRENWISYLKASGFESIGTSRLLESAGNGENQMLDLGGLIWGYRSSKVVSSAYR